MELLEFPNRREWERRNRFLENEIEKAETGHSYLISDHSVALFYDLQACYNIGAWISVIFLSVSVLDSHLRETEAMDSRIGTADLLREYFDGSDEDMDWLRRTRNSYVHVNINAPALSSDLQFNDRNKLEADATKAMRLVIKAFFQSPGT